MWATTSVLVVTPADGQKKKLTLEPKPNELVEEKVGDSSYFQGHAAVHRG
jgi:hypothetical protein